MIEWDKQEDSCTNRGTDGEGVIVNYDTISLGGDYVVTLNLTCYVGDGSKVDGKQLSHMSEEIAALMRKHLG